MTLAPGDRVIFSSRTIPGNERAVNTIINALVDAGAEIVTDREALVHTSGHPRRNEIRQLYDWTKPQIVIPVHGEALHLHEQAKIARAAGVPQVIEVRNGRMVRLAPGPAEPLDIVANGRLYRDGRLLVPHEKSGVSERRRLGFAGIVSIAVVLSDSGDVLEDPLIVLVGLPEGAEGSEPLRKIVEERGRRCARCAPEGAPAGRRAGGRSGPARREGGGGRGMGQEAGNHRPCHPCQRLSRSMLGRLNHVALAVPDLEAAAALYRHKLGARLSEPQALPEHGVTIVFVDLPNTRIELLEPLGENSPIAAFLERKPEGGMHHLCYEVDDLRGRYSAAEAGRRPNSRRWRSMIGAHGNPVVFLHPKDFAGTLIELEEVRK